MVTRTIRIHRLMEESGLIATVDNHGHLFVPEDACEKTSIDRLLLIALSNKHVTVWLVVISAPLYRFPKQVSARSFATTSQISAI